MKSQEIWKYIHSERAQLAKPWTRCLSSSGVRRPGAKAGRSTRPSTRRGAAEQTPLNFYRELISAGFKFDVFTQRGATRLAKVSPEELIRRLRARTTTTNHRPRRSWRCWVRSWCMVTISVGRWASYIIRQKPPRGGR